MTSQPNGNEEIPQVDTVIICKFVIIVATSLASADFMAHSVRGMLDT